MTDVANDLLAQLEAAEASNRDLTAKLAEANAVVADKAYILERYAEQKDALSEAVTAKNLAYTERNRLVAFVARMLPTCGTRKTDIPGWDPEWHGCVFIDTVEGQLSWHYHDSDAHLFASLLPYPHPWDGHSTPEKYERLWKLTLLTEGIDRGMWVPE